MLARRDLPQEYRDWNRKWGATSNQRAALVRSLATISSSTSATRHNPLLTRVRGPFAFQQNSSTRLYEYPWVHHLLSQEGQQSRVLEIGGALSGLQFILAKEGHEVHNVDPFVDYGTGRYFSQPGTGSVRVDPADPADPVVRHAALNRAFATDVLLHRSALPEAELTGTFSAAYCVSTIEHLSPADIEATLVTLKQLMAPGGLVVLTVDLFLNLTPFCSRTTNEWGSNVSVARLDELLGYTMVAGDPRELYGYPAFSADDIQARLDEFAIGVAYPQMAQLVAFRAPAD